MYYAHNVSAVSMWGMMARKEDLKKDFMLDLTSCYYAGIDFSMTALFVTVFVEQWLTTQNHLPAIAGLICSVSCLMVFGAGNFLIPAMISITIVLSLCKSRIDTKGAAEHE